MFRLPSPSTRKVGSVGRRKKIKIKKMISKYHNSFKLKTIFSLKFQKIWVGNGTLKKKCVGRAMGNETIYWDGLKTSFGWAYKRGVGIIRVSLLKWNKKMFRNDEIKRI